LKSDESLKRYTKALVDHALEDAALEVMIRHERAELARESAELDAMIEAMKKAKETERE
jgi:hypothetical protein